MPYRALRALQLTLIRPIFKDPKGEFSMGKKTTVNDALLKDDLYQAVNGEWLKNAVIPADKATTGGFADLADNIEETLMSDFGKLLTGQDRPQTKEMAEFVKFYRLASDFEARNQAGFAPAKKYLDKILALKDLKAWQDALPDLFLESYDAPFELYVSPDMKDTKHYALHAAVPSLFLPDKTYYEPGNEQAKTLLQILEQMLTELFKSAGYDEEFSQKTIKQALAYDKKLAPFQKDSTERADYVKSYNKYTFQDFVALSEHVDLAKVVTALLGKAPEQVIVSEPKYYAALNELVNEQNFESMRSWLFVKTLLDLTGLLSDEIRVLGGTYNRALSGSKEAMKPQKAAFYLATNQYSQVVGLYYAHKYFGAQAKADVHHMVEKMITVYKKRLEENEWLSDETRKKAIVKLDALGINVGYPDELDPLYSKFIVNDDLNLVDNVTNFTKIATKRHFERIDEEVDRTRWEMPAHMVNAYYHPSFNIIVFPAAILQAPFYSLEQSSSANYGGIGAVIAHEISHAFDNNGAQFDEHGNLANWWTKEDLAHFQKLAEKMIAQFDGLELPAGKVNGKLVVSENIADAGGLSCALEAAKSEPDADLREFFINWARIWGMKSAPEREKLLLAIDVHAPHVLRANIQPRNLDDFYQVFDVRPGDGMYLAPDKRIAIW